MKRVLFIVIALTLLSTVTGFLARDCVVGAYNGTDITVADVFHRVLDIGFLKSFHAVFNSFSKTTRFALVGIAAGLLYVCFSVKSGPRNGRTVTMTPRVRGSLLAILAVLVLYIMTNGWSLEATSLLFGFNVTSGSLFPNLPYRMTDTQALLDYYYWISWFDFLGEWHPVAVCVLAFGVVWSIFKATVVTFDHVKRHSDGSIVGILFMPVIALFALLVALFAPYRISHQVLPDFDEDENLAGAAQFARYLTVLGVPSALSKRASLWLVAPNNIFNMLMDRHGSYIELIMRRMNKK